MISESKLNEMVKYADCNDVYDCVKEIRRLRECCQFVYEEQLACHNSSDLPKIKKLREALGLTDAY